jgi:hypothetical protein
LTAEEVLVAKDVNKVLTDLLTSGPLTDQFLWALMPGKLLIGLAQHWRCNGRVFFKDYRSGVLLADSPRKKAKLVTPVATSEESKEHATSESPNNKEHALPAITKNMLPAKAKNTLPTNIQKRKNMLPAKIQWDYSLNWD